MYDSQLVDGTLQSLAKRLNNERREDDSDVPDGLGWGQFLDRPTDDTQIGPYGTCAGAIVLSLAGQPLQGPNARVKTLLTTWWRDWADSIAGDEHHLTQNLRFAFMLLATRLGGLSDLAAEMELELVERRRLPNGLFGDWWIDKDAHDTDPKLIPSAVALLALALDRQRDDRYVDISHLADDISRKVLATPTLPRLHTALSLTALYSVNGYRCKRRINRLGRRHALSTLDIGDIGVYFYEYRSKDKPYDRDYFIVPTELAVAVGGQNPAAPFMLRIRSGLIVSALLKKMSQHEAYRPG